MKLKYNLIKIILLSYILINFNINLLADESAQSIDYYPEESAKKDDTNIVNDNFEKIQTSLKNKAESLSDLSVTATSTEINQALDGIGVTVTAANLNTLTDSSNADGLHTHGIMANEYSSDWFSVSLSTLYTKAHGITLDFPDDPLVIYIFWRASSGGSYVVYLGYADTQASAIETWVSHDGTNIYIKSDASGFGTYVDSSGSLQTAGAGELLILASKIS